MSISQNYPTVRPQLLIDLANTQKLDPRLTFARASVGTYYDANGVLQTAPSGVARFQFDPVTGESLGLLRENQATNLALYSEDFSNAAWGALSGTLVVTPNTAIAPDGTLTADTIALANGYKLQAFFSLSVGVAYSFTAYMKTDIGTKNIQLRDASGGSATTVTVTTSWQRFTLVYTPTSTTGYLGVDQRSGTSPSQSGNIYIWGAQNEANSYPTSYIPTVASQVTRAADTATLTNTDAYNTAEFTAVSSPFGVSGVSANTVTLNGDVPIERLYVYPRNISQNEINTLVENDGWWSWRIVGSDFALPIFLTNGTVIVDWGDGTVETLTTAVHTFTNASPHTVRFRLASGTEFRPRINANATHKNKVVALGSAPSNMIVDCNIGFYNCTNLKSFDATLIGSVNYTDAWRGCSSLTSFPLIDTSSATILNRAWYGCSSLQSFPLINTSLNTGLNNTWYGCSSLTSFPLINTSLVTDFTNTWYGCSSLTSFPAINASSGTTFRETWRLCSSLISFPLINMNLGTNFTLCWYGCTSMTDFPANFFDSWTGTPLSGCFYLTWDNCFALTTTSVENILVSIDTSGTSAPAGNTEITIDYNVATGALTAPTTSAITSLQGKSWTIKINGVLQ